jgi:hypothetical protein
MAYPGIKGSPTVGTGNLVEPIGTPQRITIPSVLTTGALPANVSRSLTIPTGATSAALQPASRAYYTVSTPPTDPTINDFVVGPGEVLDLDNLSALTSVRLSSDIAAGLTDQVTVQFFG